MKSRTRIPRASKKRLAANGDKPLFSSIRKKPRKPIRKVNVEATKKRRARNAKRMRGMEYQSARSGAMERAGGRCEYESYTVVVRFNTGFFANDMRGRIGERERCPETEKLQFHEKVTADDGVILCAFHHRLTEKQKMHKAHRGGF